MLVVLPKSGTQHVVHSPGCGDIVLVFKVLIDTPCAADGFDLAGNSIDKMSSYPDVATFLDTSDDKVLTVGADDPVITTLRQRTGLDSKAFPTLG